MKQNALSKETGNANERITQILLEQDELTWQTLIQELVSSQEMDPWDIDVTKLAESFLDLIKTLQEMDFRITGKLVLAAAILVKLKSKQLLEEDITALDQIISGMDEDEAMDLLEDLPLAYPTDKRKKENPGLIPRTPQPRKRKVSVDDLITALEKALEVEVRRVENTITPEVPVPIVKVDISKVIKDVYSKVYEHHKKNGGEKLNFYSLVPEEAEKEEKIFTFIPLLHLDHQRNIDLVQEENFGDIHIEFLKEAEGHEFKVDENDLGN